MADDAGLVSDSDYDYAPVRIATIEVGYPLECDLYVRTGPGCYALALRAGQAVSALCGSLVAGRLVDTLYCRREDANTYAAYLVGRLDRVLEEETAVPEAQAAAAFESVHFLTGRLFEEPRAETIAAMEHTVGQSVSTALAKPDVMRAMLLLTRHDAYTYSHSVNVAVFGTALAVSLREERGPEWVRRVSMGMSLHDIGKSQIPLEVLNHPGRFSEEQRRIMMKHPELGIEVLEAAGRPYDAIEHAIILHHHERPDGRGYPHHLVGDEIPYEARLCTLCDVFDALTTDRPYRQALRAYDGLGIMKAEMRDSFDPVLFPRFVQLFAPVS